MNEDPEIFDDDLELENILKPRAEFRVSPTFKQRVMEEAKAMPARSHRRWIPFVVSSAAAAIASIVILFVWIFRSPEDPADGQPVTASVKIPAHAHSDTLNQVANSPLIAEASTPIQSKVNPQSGTAKKKSVSKSHSSPRSISREGIEISKPLKVTKGEMPKIGRDGPLNPDEVRAHLLETRRNAEIAYIEQIRDEIEANQAYIAQLMAEVNVNQ